MSKTYKAIIKDGRIYWEDEQPSANHSINVRITVLSETPAQVKETDMADPLEKLAQKRAFSSVSDPVQWQKDLRRDRSILS
ncbi:MAG TPA: hypothetical protein VFG39_06055 [Balneolaceae bacterium]|nr:hypothetical protein [Balneolaceae bacterium]